MHNLGLTESDASRIRGIIAEVESSVRCEIGIAGSIAQRALSTEIATVLKGKKPGDIDLLLISTDAAAPELPRLRELFDVVEVVHDTGWYYGMRHKGTGTWVDLFTPLHSKNLASIELWGRTRFATALESQILYLAGDILRRSGTMYPIRSKWLTKLKQLNSLESVEWSKIQQEYNTHKEEFVSHFPKRYQAPGDVKEFVRMALDKKATPKYKDKLFLIYWQFFLRKNKA